MRLSVVIPTFQRVSILRRCLESFVAQDFPNSKFEIIVVEDGASQSAEAEVQKFAKSVRFPVSFLRQKKAGQGVARNKGVEQAKGEIIIFIGDDIFVTPDFLKLHENAHRIYPEKNEAVLGYIDWHPELFVTPLMRFMTSGGAILKRFGGHQFAYDLLEGKPEADFRFFYTSNISLKRSLLLEHPFDPWFSSYGWEDIELGYRLTKKADLKLRYEPNAVGFHYHPMELKDFERRMRGVGRSAVHFNRRYPELKKVPAGMKRKAFEFLGHPAVIRMLRASQKTFSGAQNFYLYALSKKYFLEGVREEE